MYVKKSYSKSLNKIALVRRNKPEAVILPIEEYERLREISEYLEYQEIHKIVQERVENRKTPAKYIFHEEMLKLIDKRLKKMYQIEYFEEAKEDILALPLDVLAEVREYLIK